MSSKVYVEIMARYNHWQNRSLIAAADGLDDAARGKDRGAFFGSIQGTFSHLLWADRMWMSRFSASPKPPVPLAESARMVTGWAEFKRLRDGQDAAILNWAQTLEEGWLDREMTWMNNAVGKLTQPHSLLVMHFFNHQTHHRGQIHAMLTAAGARPGATDLPVMPADIAMP